MSGYPFGVWAGDLAYHNGTWYCYQIDARHGLYMSSATDIRGPWSEPINGIDVDGDGIGEPVLEYRKPIQGFPITAPGSDDEFNAADLGKQWEWNHNPRDTHWSLTEKPGWLRLKASLPVSDDLNDPSIHNPWRNKLGAETTFWRACNTVSQRIMRTTTGSAVAKFDVSKMRPGQRAGFVRYGGVYHLLGVHMDNSGDRTLFFMDTEGREIRGPKVKGKSLYIRSSNNTDQAFFEYSTDGKTFEQFGPEFTLKFGSWTGDRLGFFCWNEREEAGHIDVDYFH